MTKNIVFIIFTLISQLVFSDLKAAELFCDASKVQNKDWSMDVKGYQQEDYKKILPIWLSKAEDGNPKYQFYTAKAYYFGKGVDKDLNKAVYWYKKSSEQGYPIAKNNLALMYADGEGVKKDTFLSFKLLCNAAIQNVTVAQNNIIGMLVESHNDSQAFKWINIALSNGSEYAKKYLAKLYMVGLIVDQDFEKAKEVYLDLYNSSESKETRATSALNIAHYYNVKNSDFEDKKAFEWYLIASKLGSGDAKYSIGSIYYDKKDYKHAFVWFQDAAKEGNVNAIQSLGIMYRNGWSVDQDLEKSVALAIKAESLGNIEAIYNLAVAYDKGEGVQKDKIKALNLFLKSAKKGNVFAQLVIGKKYLEGDGVDIDLKESAYWYYKTYKNDRKIPKDLYQHKLAIIYFRNIDSKDIVNLTKEFIFGELIPTLKAEDLSLMAYDLEKAGKVKEAIPLFEMAAKKGHDSAMTFLGTLFSAKFIPEYGGKYYDLERAVYWLEKSSKNNIISNLTLARIYFGVNDFSYMNLEKAYKYSSQATKLLNSGLANDHQLYKDKVNILEGIYEHAAIEFTERGMHEIAEGLIREISKKPAKDGLLSDDLARKMHLANLAQNPEEFENIYLDVVNNTNITSEEDLINIVFALEKLSTIYLAQGSYQKSIDILVNNFNKLSGKEIDLSPFLMIKVAANYLEWGDFDKAKAYLDKYKGLVNNTQDEFYRFIKNELKGQVELLGGIVNAMNGENIDSAYVKMQKGIDQMFKDQSSSKGLTVANGIMKRFIQIGKFNYAYEISKPIVDAYKNNFNDRLLKGIKISRQEKESIKNVLSNFIYVAEKTDKTELDFGFEIMQLAAGLDASDALVKTIYKRKMGLGNSSIIDKLESLRLKKKIIIREKLSKITLNRDELLDVNSKLNHIDKEISAIQGEIVKKGLNSNSINLFVSSAQEVIGTLHKQDALLTMLVSKERTFVWLITSNGVYRHHANIGKNPIKAMTDMLLSSLNPSKGDNSKLSIEISSKLYDLLIRPFEKELKGIDRLVIVPDSILSGIPFSILNNSEGKSVSGKLNYIDTSSTRGIDRVHANILVPNIGKDNWLINEFAISIVPSIYSYIESAKLAKIRVNTKNSFIGIGNPSLSGTIKQVDKEILRAYVNTRGTVSNFVSEMTPLPETEIELTQIAKEFSRADLILGKDATEKNLKAIDLSQYGVVSFATHALVSNEIEGIVEPSLVLTPVDENNPNNDGLLTASEISNLKLDADIVLLSACNTASSFGESNSQGLSGLANSFFNAGARSLLVSYWSVISESAVDITTRIFKPSNEGRSYAHKHRNAVLDLLKNSKDTYKLRPSYWAPFSVIGVN